MSNVTGNAVTWRCAVCNENHPFETICYVRESRRLSALGESFARLTQEVESMERTATSGRLDRDNVRAKLERATLESALAEYERDPERALLLVRIANGARPTERALESPGLRDLLGRHRQGKADGEQETAEECLARLLAEVARYREALAPLAVDGESPISAAYRLAAKHKESA